MTYTFDSIKTELKKELSLLSSWATTLYYGVYDRIMDVVSYGIVKDAYLANFLYKEAGWLTAEKLSSLAKLSWMLNYTPYRKQGASGNIIVSGSSTFSSTYSWTGSNVYIPKWTKFTNTSKTINVYCTTFTTYYTNTLGNLSIPVKEGTPKEYTYIATGSVNEKIYLYSDSIDNDEMAVYIVDSLGNILSQVTKADNLYLLNAPDTYYYTSANSSNYDYVYITFGDNVHSKQLTSGTYVLIKYAETTGYSGNITTSGVLTKIESTLYNSVGEVVTNLYTTNSDSIIGGTNYEDIDSIRSNASNLFGAGYRCGTGTDWNTVINSISFIYQGKVWSINDLGGSNLISEQNTVFITAINASGAAISSAQQTELTSMLTENYSSPTEVINFVTPVKVYLVFEVTATITNSTTSIMKQSIKDIIYNNYSILNSSFARKIYQSEYIALISTISNIVFHETNIKLMDYNLGYSQINSTFRAFYTSTILTNEVLVITNSPQLWIKRKIAGVWQDPLQIAYASGTSLIGMNGYTLSSTAIAYNTGVYSYIIDTVINNPTIYGVNNPTESEDLGYIVTLMYQTQDGNSDQQDSARLMNKYLITDVDTDFFPVIITEQD
jgi:intracellular septation protein A